ncbi:hypothetical protein [Chitinophaga sp. Ak27]|uniref:hypothetical protein n=1 Tax=Chitinophaga sp. Ak27 TaxID=2726116 RepID=UPI00145F408D|nr:hypothetical protein [Chitinophaga sp. Ak27]NLU92776.1 hypothetical protein [Chitinophaga sp. Ak27]
MSIRLICMLFCTMMAISCSYKSFGQDIEKAKLEKAIGKQFRYPADLAANKVTSFFALRIFLSSEGKVDSIQTSRFTPKKMITELTKKSYLSGINWEKVIHHKVQVGESIIIPLVAYYDSGQNEQTFYEYTLTDIINFNGVNDVISNCAIVPTIAIPYNVYK